MKYATTILGAIALAGESLAFPASVFDALARDPARPLERRLNGINPGFNATLQYVSNTGAHKFVAPKSTDLRGPCPGLNALANHNYLPHNGVATIAQFVEQTNKVFGMGLDLGTFLSVYAAIFDGDLLSWSIGGPPPVSLVSPLAGLIGQPQGLSGSHNKYEADVSPGRGDLYLYGNDYKLVLKQFKALYSMQIAETEETSNYDLGVLTSFRVKRFQQSVSQNPYFFNGPFSGFQVQPAAYTFMYRFMANHSEEFPAGRLSQNVMKTFFSVTGTYPNFKYRPGYEKIPSNWYRRAIGDEYTIPFFEQDLLAAAVQYPQFLNIGGNLGKTNTFTGVDITNLTGGVYNAANLTSGNNALCLSYQLLIQQSPDVLENIFVTPGVAQALLEQVVGNITDGLGCPQLNDVQQGQFDKYPGYASLLPNGTYPKKR